MTTVLNAQKVKSISAVISDIPGDKSMSHRSIIIGSLAQGRSEIHNFLCSDDCINTAKIFSQLGVAIEVDTDKKIVRIDGVGLHGLSASESVLDVGNAGTGIRLITGVLAAQHFDSTITGDDSIQVRPMKRIMTPLAEMGADISGRYIDGKDDIYPPLKISGGQKIAGQTHTLAVASAQVKSAILLAGLYATDPTTVIEPDPPSRDHTEKCLNRYQVRVQSDGQNHTLYPGPLIAPKDPVHIPSDFSSAAFFIVLGLLLPDSEITLTGISLNPTRAALLDHLIEMGGNIHIELESPDDDGEAYGRIVVKSSTLKNIPVATSRLPFLIDEIPILSIAALLADGQLKLREAEELRVKESDRITAIANLINALGGQITEYDDGFDIEGGRPDSDALIIYDAGHDHRLAMSAIIAAIVLGRPAQINGDEYIDTSFPNFKDILKRLDLL